MAEFVGKVSNCSIDENGRAEGGKPGDQTGSEYYIKKWYPSHGWKYVFRHPENTVRGYISYLAEAAANNDCIGYHSGSGTQRLGMWNELQKVNYRPENITTNCAADCSSSTAAIVKSVGYLLGNKDLQKMNEDTRTWEMYDDLTSIGFTALPEKKYLTSADYLVAGDILLCDGHTCICITNGPKADKAFLTTLLSAVNGSVRDLLDVKKLDPYIAILDDNTENIDYEILKKSKVFSTLIEAGSYYSINHTTRSTVETKLMNTHIQNTKSAELQFALYFHSRAKSVDEAKKEFTAYAKIIQQHVPNFGVWLQIHFSSEKSKKETNNKILDYYEKGFNKLGLGGQIGLYVTKSQLKTIDWDNHRKTEWYLWIIDRMTNQDNMDKKLAEVLNTEFFLVDTEQDKKNDKEK